VGIAGKNDKALVHTIFSTWLGWLLQHKANFEIHEKFKQEIQDAEDALVNFKTKQKGISKGILGRAGAAGDAALIGECLRLWFKYVVTEGHNKEMDKALEEANARFNAAQQSSKDASKSVMARMSAGNDAALLTLCLQAWVAMGEELKMDKEIDALAKKAEQQYKEFMAKKNGEARGVLDRMSSGSESGLLHLVMVAWQEAWKEGKAEREMERIISEQEGKFKSLNQRQKGNAKSAASRCHASEEENMIMVFFYAWATDTATERVVRHYGGKLDQKKHQLESVQTMFRSFANQLEQGIGNTPRSQRKSRGSASSAASGAPPLPSDPPS
jgi:hypothetical protein